MRITKNENGKFTIEASGKELRFLHYAADNAHCSEACPYFVGDCCDEECLHIVVRLNNAVEDADEDNQKP